MSDGVKPTAIFWITAIIALLWYLMGCVVYLHSHWITPEQLIPIYGREGSDIVIGRPAWQAAGWALAVFGGLIGTIGFILRRAWSRILFFIALIGSVVYDLWVFTSGYFQHSVGFDKFVFVVSILAPLFLIVFSTRLIKNGVLR